MTSHDDDALRVPFLWPFRRRVGHGADRTEGRPTIDDDPVATPAAMTPALTPSAQLPPPPVAPHDYVTQILAPAAWQYIRDYNTWNAASLQAIYTLLYQSSTAQQQQLGTQLLALQALQTEVAGVFDVLEDLLRFQRSPVRGRIHLRVGKDQPMTIAVHPSDTLTFDVAWENAENQVVPEVSPTTWDTVDASGASVAVGTLSLDSASDDRGSLAPPLALVSSVFLQATTHDDQGAAVVARSDEDINVADTNVARGTVHVSVSPTA